MVPYQSALLRKLLSKKSTSIPRIYFFIAERVRAAETPSVTISIAEIARSCRLSKQTVSMVIRYLISANYLGIVVLPRPGQMNQFALQEGPLVLPDDSPPPAPKTCQTSTSDEFIDEEEEYLNWVGDLGFEGVKSLWSTHPGMSPREYYDSHIANKSRVTPRGDSLG
jgi:hypothetical protein